MRRFPIVAVAAAAVAAVAVAGAPARAAADEPIGFAFDWTVGGGGYLGAIGEHARHAAVHMRLGAGLSKGPWAALLSVEMPTVFDLDEAASAAQPMPPTVSYIGFGIGPSVRRELTRGPGFRTHVRLGYAWRWLHGDLEVRRTCHVHGGCAGGFWTETPTYPAHGPTVAIGISGRTDRDTWAAFGVELAAGHLVIDRRGLDPDLSGTFISLGVNIAFGRGAR